MKVRRDWVAVIVSPLAAIAFGQLPSALMANAVRTDDWTDPVARISLFVFGWVLCGVLLTWTLGSLYAWARSSE